MIKKFGQYFTKNTVLQNKVVSFILNNPSEILEPSVGRGDLIFSTLSSFPSVLVDCFEIDEKINLINKNSQINLKYCDFLEEQITKKYKTIIGNPPYVKTSRGNLYIDFIEKCVNLLDTDGELIFIIPSDFFKLTSASSLISFMLENGHFTHLYRPNNESLFESASIDIIIFRYQKTLSQSDIVQYSEGYPTESQSEMRICHSNGIITLSPINEIQSTQYHVHDFFDVYVGMVSGKDSIFKNESLGNIKVLTDENTYSNFIFTESFPSNDKDIDNYLCSNKEELLDRKIKKFNEKNWWSWGAPRNIKIIKKSFGLNCIYIKTLTRAKNVSFIGNVEYFGGSLILLVLKSNFSYINLKKINKYFNSEEFKFNYTYANRFKIGHKQICNSIIPKKYL